MRSTTVRGTPYTHIGAGETRNQGISPRTPAGNRGTGEAHTAEPGIRTGPQGPGTPYHSQAGNSDEFMREVSQDKYGKVIDPAAGDQSDPKANGDGVVLDGANEYQRGFEPRAAETTDSPVPRHASVFDAGTVPQEDRAHMGKGRGQPEQANPDLVAIGGVMSRGLDSTSHADEPEDELTRDDTLKGNAGSYKDVND